MSGLSRPPDRHRSIRQHKPEPLDRRVGFAMCPNATSSVSQVAASLVLTHDADTARLRKTIRDKRLLH